MRRIFFSSSSAVSRRFKWGLYEHDVNLAKKNAEEFWKPRAAEVDWFVPPTRVAPAELEGAWCADGVLNTAHEALDRHVLAGRGGNTALDFESIISGERRTFSFSDLQHLTSTLAHVYEKFGIKTGDCVLIFMPQVPEAIIAMLAAARAGAPHCVCFAGFAPNVLASRIEHVKPKLILTADFALEGSKRINLLALVKQTLELTTFRPPVLVYRREGLGSDSEIVDGFEDFGREMSRAAHLALYEPVPVPATHPLYYLHTSGTTGQPKALVREHGSHAVGLLYAGREIYGLNSPGDCFWAASDIGWVVGHSWTVYGPMLAGAKSLVVEGKPVGCPDHLEWFRLLERHRVSTFFCAPTALRAIRKESTQHATEFERFNLLNLRAFFVAGEKCDSSTFKWIERIVAPVPVCDNWWQTETGWPITTRGFVGSYGVAPHVEGSSGLPVPGYDVSIRRGNEGDEEIVVRLPLPPGSSRTLFGSEVGFADKYLRAHPGFYATGDAGSIDPTSGDVIVRGRTDDVINVAGHRLTTSQMEEVIAVLEGVAEVAVVGVADSLKGQVPVAFVVSHNIDVNDVVQAVRERVGAVASLKRVYRVQRLPKTRSGKLLRSALRNLAEQKHFPVPPTIEDASVLEEIEKVVKHSK